MMIKVGQICAKKSFFLFGLDLNMNDLSVRVRREQTKNKHILGKCCNIDRLLGLMWAKIVQYLVKLRPLYTFYHINAHIYV